MSKENLDERIVKKIKIIGKKHSASEGQINSIIALVREVRKRGSISDDELFEYFKMVGGN